ncbi:hypothetical protein [Streptomyces sp. NPDC001985]|uniref:hypothetical protein n=1 Tax=Streptomyces sp. NPDC001985 TaxID=3154406 RepID=UPI003330DEC5
MAGKGSPEIAVEPRDLELLGGHLKEVAGSGLPAIGRRMETAVIPEADAEFFPGTVELKATVDSVRDSITEEITRLAGFLRTLGDDLIDASRKYRDSEDMARATADELGRLLQETSEFIDVREAGLAKAEERETGRTSERAARRGESGAPGGSDGPGPDGSVRDPEADGDNNGVKDGDQYVEGDADLDNDGRLDTFEKEYGDKDDDGLVDHRDDAEGNGLPVDDTPGDNPVGAVPVTAHEPPAGTPPQAPGASIDAVAQGFSDVLDGVGDLLDGLAEDQDLDGVKDSADNRIEIVDKDNDGVNDTNLDDEVDSDRDGYADDLEIVAGSDPNDPAR